MKPVNTVAEKNVQKITVGRPAIGAGRRINVVVRPELAGRADAVLVEGETISDLAREAIEREVARRERRQVG